MDGANHARVGWEEPILNKLNDGWLANTVAALFEVVWYRRNQMKHNDRLVEIVPTQIIYRLKCAKEADLDRTFKIVTAMVRKEQHCTEVTQSNNITITIQNKLERISKKWNNNTMKITIPPHFIRYCTIRTDFARGQQQSNNNN